MVLAFANTGVFLKWSIGPDRDIVLGLWMAMLLCFVVIEMCLQRMITHSYRTTALPFALTLLIFILMLGGLGYSFFPYLVLDNITIWDAAASVSALQLILTAAGIALPVVLIFNIWVYRGMLGLSKAPTPPEFRS